MKKYIQFLFLVGVLATSVASLKGMNPETGEVSGLQEERVIDAESNIVFSTKEGELVVIPFKYIVNQSKTLEDLVTVAGGSSEKIPVNFSSKTFHFVKGSFQVSSLSSFVEGDLDESAREFNVEDLIELANCATWLDYQALMRAMIRIIAQRCNAHEMKSPTEVLDDYKNLGLTDEFASEVAKHLKKYKEKDQKNSSNEAMVSDSEIQLETSDRKLVSITSEQAQFFKMITNLVGDFGSGSERIPLSNVSKTVLNKLIALLPLINEDGDEEKRFQATLIRIKEATKEYGFQEIKELFEASDYLASDKMISVFATIIEQRFNDVKARGNVTELVTMMKQLPILVIYRIVKDVTTEPFLMKIQAAMRGIIPKKLIGHEECSIVCLNFSPDGSTIATGSEDTTMRLWDVADGRCLQVFRGHTGRIKCLNFSPDGLTIATGATGSSDNTARLWDVADGSCLHVFRGHEGLIYHLSFSPDGLTIATGSYDNTARLWNVADGSCLQVFRGHEGPIYCLSFSPDGSTIATGSGDKTMRLWNVADDSCLQVFRGHKSSIRCLSFSRNGLTIATGSFDDTMRLWNIADGKCLHKTWKNSVSGHHSSFSPDGLTIVTSFRDNTIMLWNVADGGCLRVFRGHDISGGLSFSPNGLTIATGGGDKTMRLWDVADGSCLQVFAGHEGPIYCLSFSPDGLTVATGSNDGTAILWNLFDRELQAILKQLTFEQLLLVKLSYEAHQQKKHFNFLANDYLREIYQSCPKKVRETIDYFVSDQSPWYKKLYGFLLAKGS